MIQANTERAGIFRRNLSFIAIIFTVSGFLIWCVYLFTPNQLRLKEYTDYVYYYFPVGENIFNGHGITLAEIPAVRYPPGMPLLVAASLQFEALSGINLNTQNFFLAVIYLSGSAIFLLFFLKEITNQDRWSLVAPLTFVTYPLVLYLGQQPNSEFPFLFFFYGSIFLLFSKNTGCKTAFFAGCLIGFSMLIRPVAIGCGILLAVIYLFVNGADFRRRSLISLAFLLGNVICVLPWEVWAYHKTGQIIPLSSGSFPTIRDGLTFAMNPHGYRSQDMLYPGITLPLMQDIYSHIEFNTTAQIADFMLAKFVDQPGEILVLFFTKALRSWYATDSGSFERYILFLQMPYLIISFFGFYSCIWLGREYKQLAVLTGGLVLYFWIMTIFALSIVRYMIPAMGLMFCTWIAIPELIIRARLKRLIVDTNHG